MPSCLERRVLTAIELPAAKRGPLPIAHGSEIWITRDDAGIAEALVSELSARGHAARCDSLQDDSPRKAPVGGLIIVGPLAFSEPAVAREGRLKSTFAIAKQLAPHLKTAADSGGALLSTIARMDGQFGLTGGEFDPVQGGLAGLTKTAAHEWPGVRCRALDVSRSWRDAPRIACAIADELERAGPIEVGLDRDTRRGLEMTPAAIRPRGLDLAPGDVVVITGGARGVTAAVAAELARLVRPTLVLLGRSPAPHDEPDWLRGLDGDADMKRAILAHEFSGRRPTPAQIERSYRAHLANREVARNLGAMTAAGAQVEYRQVDLRDDIAVRTAMNDVRKSHGPIRALIHGAGVLEDRRIEDKTQAQFDTVFDTKVAGLRGLLAGVDPADLRYLVLFSSVTARFGRQGQVDYAMANEVLNKVAQRWSAGHAHCRAVSINWGPWDGGMVHAGLKREFEKLGVPLIPLDAGARAFVEELSADDRAAVEVIIGSGFPNPPKAAPRPVRTVASATVAFERELDVERYPFLRSHMIAGRPVLPMAMMLEWLAHGALHTNPGLVFCGMDDLRVLKGIVLPHEPYSIRVLCDSVRRGDAGLVVPVELRGGGRGAERLHARARVTLADRPPDAPAAPPDPATTPFEHAAGDIYRDILFHGPDFHAIRAIDALDDGGLVARIAAGPAPGRWMAEPLRTEWNTDPLQIDAAFQLGIVWTQARLGALSLPSFCASYRQFRANLPRDGSTLLLHVRATTPLQMTADATWLDASWTVVAQARGIQWTVDRSLTAAFAQDAATAGAAHGV